ncbi:TPA: hypothetical protein ACQVKY_005338, partial [Serratia marcescens]
MNLEKEIITEKTTAIAAQTKTIFDKATNTLSKVSPFAVGFDHESLKLSAYEWAENITTPNTIFNNPYVPLDLRKSQARTIKSSDGKYISSLTTARDWTMGGETGINKITMALMLAGVIGTSVLAHSPTNAAIGAGIALGAYKFIGGPSWGDFFLGAGLAGLSVGAYQVLGLGGQLTLTSLLPLLLPSIAMYASNYLKKKSRAKEHKVNGNKHANDMGEESNYSKLEAQIKQGIIDDEKAPAIPLAVSTGEFQKRGSFESPDRGTVMMMNLMDFFQHMFIMGKPGTGKSMFLRQIIKQFDIACRKMGKKIGMLLMDGKGELAGECRKILDLIIHPREVESFCLVDIDDATKWQTIIKTVARVVLEGPNADFGRTALEYIYNSALCHEFLRDLHRINPDSLPDFKWSYMYRYNLMSMMLEPNLSVGKDGQKQTVLGKGEIICQLLETHPNIETDPRIKQLIFNIRNDLVEAKQDFAMKCLKNAQGYMQAVLQSKDIIKWADSETTSIDVLDCLKGKKIGVAMPFERFGAAGELVSQLVKAKVRNAIAMRENNWRDDPTATELLFIQDEFQDLFNADDENNVPKDRSRGCCNIVASQTISAIYSKASKKEIADTFLTMFASFVELKTTDKHADEFMQMQCGFVRNFDVVTPSGTAIAFRETAQALASRPDFDPTHPDAEMFRKFRTDVSFNFRNLSNPQSQPTPGLIGKVVGNAETHALSYYQYDKQQPFKKLMGDDMFGKLDEKSYAVCVFKRGGGWVKDIAILKRVSP